MDHTLSNARDKNRTHALDGASVTLWGSVEKIIPSIGKDGSDAVQIVIEGAESLYREIRIQNLLQDGNGEAIALRPGSQVEITIKVRPRT